MSDYMNLSSIDLICCNYSLFLTKSLKLRNKTDLDAFTNPLTGNVASGQQTGVLGGGAPWHVTCVEDGNFKDEKRKRTLCAFQR